MRFRTLGLEETPGCIRVTLSRGRSQNAINRDLLDELHLALDAAERSAACRVVVLAGDNGVFCTGMDFGELVGAREALAAPEKDGQVFFDLLKRLTTIPRVVVCSVDGRVAGGGVGLVAASDFAFATERSQFSLPEALWGLLPCCVLPFLIRRVGFQRAYTMALSTLPVAARQAERFALVDEVHDEPDVPLRRLQARVLKLEDRSIGQLKAYFRRMWFLSDEMEAAAVREFAALMSSPAVQNKIEDFVVRQKLPWES